jgi:hypothetical protein
MMFSSEFHSTLAERPQCEYPFVCPARPLFLDRPKTLKKCGIVIPRENPVAYGSLADIQELGTSRIDH